MRDSDSQSGLNINLIVPVALLAVLLIVPFSINSLLHFFTVKRQATPLVMKIPVDNNAISIPSSAKQYESFEVSLNLETQQFAKFIARWAKTSKSTLMKLLQTRRKARLIRV